MEEVILDEDPLAAINLEPADKTKRFLNWFLDRVFSFILFNVLLFFIGLFLGFARAFSEEKVQLFESWALVLFILWLIGYYWLSEWFFNGRTLAKFITGTRAISKDGLFLTPGKALGRALGRFIPFDAFSFLFSDGFHDMVSNTKVVDWPKGR